MNTCTNCGTPLSPGARFCSGCGQATVSQPLGLSRDADGAIQRGTLLENRYKIMNKLGEGGYSRVYGAVDLRLRTPCAVKENSEFDRAAYEQFIAEAQLLARLRHPHLTKVTDYFTTQDGAQWLVMEYVPGKDLEKLIKELQEYLSWQQVVQWGLIVCDVLEYLHTQDPPIIHRDIKPPNLRLMPDGTLMVIDLGIAKVQKPGTKTTRAAQAYSGGYSPIEQYLGHGTTTRSDLYALGATLYHLLALRQAPDATDRLRGATPTPLDQVRPDVPELLARAIDRAMAMEAEDRPPTASALRLVFQKLLDDDAATPALYAAPTPASVVPRVQSQPRPISQPQPISQPRPVSQPSEPLPTHTAPRAERLSQSIIWPGDGREMVPISGGTFVMGVTEGDSDEQPRHSVQLAPFLIDRFPVTCAEYARFVQATNHGPPPSWGGATPDPQIEDHPVVDVTLLDALAYAHWAGKRLPTEAEWERAAAWDARTQRSRRYPWGDDWSPERANSSDGGAGGTVPIGAYTPIGDSADGVAELVGNVWEWTASAYKPYPYDPDDGREQISSGMYVTRGGAWSCAPDVVRAANRNVCASGDGDFELGFRCAADMRG